MAEAAPADAPRWRRVLDWWIRDRSTGRIGLLQWPNPALGVWAISRVIVGVGLLPRLAEELRLVGTGALIAWAADELIRGVSPARRLLGLLILGGQLYQVLG